MTPSNIIRYILYFVGILLLQTIVLDPIQLGRFITPVLYVLFIMVLPSNIKPWLLLVLAFVSGIIADFFSDTGGIHAICMLTIGFLRVYLLPLFMSKDNIEKGTEPNLFTMGYRLFALYALSLSLIYLLLFTFLDVASLNGFFYTLTTIVASTIITVFLIFIIQLLLYRIRPKEL